MFNSIRTKIAFPVIGVLVVLVLFIVFFVASAVQDFADERRDERLIGASRAAHSYLERLEQYNEMVVHALSSNQRITSLISEANISRGDDIRPELLHYLTEIKYELGITAAVVADREGTVILRTHDIEIYGDDALTSRGFYYAVIHGRVSTAYVSTPALPMGLSSVAPVFLHGEIIGGISAITNLSYPKFVENFAEIFNAEATVFAGNTSLASTLYTDRDAGLRAVGISAAQKVAEAVLEQAQPFDLQTELFGEPYHAYYFPLFGWDGSPIGMFFIGFPIGDAIHSANSLVRNLVFIGFIGLAIAAAVMLFAIHISANKVTRVAKIVETIAGGGAYDELFNVPASKDEVGVLTQNLTTLVDAIRKLSSDRNIREIKEFLDETAKAAIDSEAANKAKSNFLSTMSHEIRTPMGAILGITEIQLRNMNLSNDVKKAFEKIHISGEMLLGIINDILDLSKIEAGKTDLVSEKYETASLIGDTAQLNLLRLGSKQIDFIVNVDETLPTHLYGDELRIKQILSNILSNAFKYTDSGTIKMDVEKVSDFAETITMVFTISDTGRGMTKEQVDSLFDAFVRFDTTRKAEGTGLGMSIVKNLVTLMQGEIHVKSEPGDGTVFRVRIPQKVASTEKIGDETAKNLSNFKYVGQSKFTQSEFEPMPYGKVLVVDDAEANIFVAMQYLAPYGISVESAESGYEVLEKVQSGKTYDIIFMDHMMPKMDGLETTRRLRESGYKEPIVAFTANAIVGQEEEFLQKGFDGFISKPIQSTLLNEVLQKFVRDKQTPEIIEAAKTIVGDIFTKTSIHKGSLDELRKDFIKSQHNVLAEIRRATDAKDFETATLLAHTLKSLAGLINEHELARRASKAETAFRENKNPSDIIYLLSTETESVLSDINEELKSKAETPVKKIKNKAKIKSIFDALQPLLAQNDAAAITMLPEIASIPGTEELVANIEAYNFDTALEILAKLTQKRTNSI
ncbi:MAG: ATP-binding protein [Defluviitaleaceae bacterium]|nr:ATP-binding protein [Defluviitaleaceae bacterium]